MFLCCKFFHLFQFVHHLLDPQKGWEGLNTCCSVYAQSFSHKSFPSWILYVFTLQACQYNKSVKKVCRSYKIWTHKSVFNENPNVLWKGRFMKQNCPLLCSFRSEMALLVKCRKFTEIGRFLHQSWADFWSRILWSHILHPMCLSVYCHGTRRNQGVWMWSNNRRKIPHSAFPNNKNCDTDSLWSGCL